MSLLPRIERTSSPDDINRWTYGLGVVFVIAVATAAYSLQYIGTSEAVPIQISGPIAIVLFVVGPALALTQTTELLYDGLRHSLRAAGLTMGVFILAYWTIAGGQDIEVYTSPVLAGLTGIFVVTLYGILLFGIFWVIQFARTGTSGVSDDFQ